MSLRHALLALIESGPFTGYDLMQKFDHTIEYVWRARHSQIYPELRKLEAEGFIAGEVLPRQDAPRSTKVAYHLTPEGRRELERWVTEVGPQPAVREPQYLKALYLEFSTPRNARRQFEAHRQHFVALRDGYTAHVDDIAHERTVLMQRRLAASPENEHAAIKAFKLHTYRGLIARCKAEIDWAEAGVSLLEELAGASGNPDFWDTVMHASASPARSASTPR